MRLEADAAERIRKALTASAVFLEMLAEAQQRWAELLRNSSSQRKKPRGSRFGKEDKQE
jgi:hypothetical protein